MTTVRAQSTIDAPATAVWDIVAHRFDHVGDWATVIPASHAAPGEPRVIGAPVAGRVCTTGIGSIPYVTERIVAYDEAGRTLTYEAEGLPRFSAPAATDGTSRRSTIGTAGWTSKRGCACAAFWAGSSIR